MRYLLMIRQSRCKLLVNKKTKTARVWTYVRDEQTVVRIIAALCVVPVHN